MTTMRDSFFFRLPGAALCGVVLCALVFAAPLLAQDEKPLTDLALVGTELVTDVTTGKAEVVAHVAVRGCDEEGLALTASVALLRDSVTVDEVDLDIWTDIGGTCANTKNGSCSGVACPDAIINGKRRKGTCEDGTIGNLCVCDYGVVSVVVGTIGAGAEASHQVFVDQAHAVREMSEENNLRGLQ